MRLLPSHVKAVAEALNDDHETVDDAARAAIRALDAARAEMLTHVVVRQYVSQVDGSASYMGYGPYSSAESAREAIEKGWVGLAGFGSVAIVPVRSEKSVLAKLKSLDELDAHMAGNHYARIKERLGG